MILNLQWPRLRSFFSKNLSCKNTDAWIGEILRFGRMRLSRVVRLISLYFIYSIICLLQEGIMSFKE